MLMAQSTCTVVRVVNNSLRKHFVGSYIKPALQIGYKRLPGREYSSHTISNRLSHHLDLQGQSTA